MSTAFALYAHHRESNLIQINKSWSPAGGWGLSPPGTRTVPEREKSPQSAHRDVAQHSMQVHAYQRLFNL
jgi:hypothetical protein